MSNYIKVGAAAKEATITPYTLKNWEKLFGWNIARDENGHRLYTEDQVKQAKAVKKQLNAGKKLKDLMNLGSPFHDSPPVSPNYKSPQPVAYGIEY